MMAVQKAASWVELTVGTKAVQMADLRADWTAVYLVEQRVALKDPHWADCLAAARAENLVGPLVATRAAGKVVPTADPWGSRTAGT